MVDSLIQAPIEGEFYARDLFGALAGVHRLNSEGTMIAAITNDWRFRREINSIKRHQKVAEAMRVTDPIAAADKVIEEAGELKEALLHDPMRAVTEAGDVFMSTRMVVQAMNYPRWMSEDSERWAIKRLALRWPIAEKIAKKFPELTWKQAWEQAKKELSNAD